MGIYKWEGEEMSARDRGYNFAKGYMMTLNLIESGYDSVYDVRWAYQSTTDGKVVGVYAIKPDGKEIYKKSSPVMSDEELPMYLEGIKQLRSEL